MGQAIARDLGVELAEHEERRFSDSEQKTRPRVDPCGADVFVVHSLHGDDAASGHDKLCRLLFFLATLRDHGAARVTAVVPYLAYARKDRRTKPFDPVTVRYVAQLFEAVGTDALVTLEAHNVAALENAFRCRAVQLQADALFNPRAIELVGDAPVVVASPDPGGVKRAQLWRELLEPELGRPVGFAFLDKRRSADVLSGGELLAGAVDGATVLLYDDLISTGSTMARAAATLLGAGARRVIAFAAHGLFVENAAEVLSTPAIERLVVADGVPPFRIEGSLLRDKVEVIASARLFAQAIRDCHRPG
ncbi:MAG: ribose-phosphate pyrophosphokinase [Burkholderiales bacterium]|nr:MAG: ribose-phosphate pyrophosphokinase [Burkholderiales bacterium]